MVHKQSLFVSFVPMKIVIKTGNPDSPLIAIEHGVARLSIGGRKILLEDCLLVPKISQQLISLVKLIDKSITIIKELSSFKICDLTSILFQGKIIDNLLHSQANPSSSAIVNHSTWNNCLGHPNAQIMKNMNLPLPDKNKICEVCVCSKITSSSFSSHF
jgi:hypothetical protein